MKEYRISARVPEELKKRLERVEKLIGIDQAIIIRKCVEALIEYVEEHGEITFPLEMAINKKRGPKYPMRDAGETIRVEDEQKPITKKAVIRVKE